MLFNSIHFIFLFLPVVFIVYFLLNKYFPNRKYSIYWLVLASLYFYGYWNFNYVYLILVSITINFAISKIFERNLTKKVRLSFLVIGISFNIGLLSYFKYVDFFINNINWLFQTNISLLHIVLPIAISFFTFQQIAYLVDHYKGNVQKQSFSSYLLFITFFPQLIAGPIVHHREMMPQFEKKDNKRINFNNINKGLFIFTIGLAKKVAIADTISIWANAGL